MSENPDIDIKRLLAEQAQQAGDDAPAELDPYPVERWHPERVYDLPLAITAENIWQYQGSPLTREPTRQVFARIMSCEDGQHYLTTPVEKARIEVADAPFQVLTFHKLTDKGTEYLALQPDYAPAVVLDAANTFELRDGVPYLGMHRGLRARLSRAVFYQLIELSTVEDIDGRACAVIQSGGRPHVLGPVED
ncbi:DUF1285 domain-containing protein [Allohahella marinimesophila]|uniref:DUF1285 domain-containing protein n=1 Tax=Allohahella marinimesophila TaxID=1054972 RepID=A0ABP7QAA3_9GAMM